MRCFVLPNFQNPLTRLNFLFRHSPMNAHKGQVIIPRNHQHQQQQHPPPHLKSVQVLRVVSTSPQLYHSVRVDQRQSRAIHVLPEKYQFCALGAKGFPTVQQHSSGGPQLGRCQASVHYGLCTDFDVFVVNTEKGTPISPASTASSTISRFTYSVKMPSKSQVMMDDSRDSVSPSPSISSTNSTTTIATRLGRYRSDENIGATLEGLLDGLDDEPAQLQSLIRNFVRQDRQQRQQQQQTTAVSSQTSVDPSIAELDALEAKLLEVVQSANSSEGTLDSKGKKRIVLKKPQQADLLARLQQQQQALQNGLLKWGLTNGGGGVGNHQFDDYSNTSSATTNTPTPFLSTSRDGVVQSRLIRFGSNSRESSPGPAGLFGTSSSYSPSTSSSPLSPTSTSSSSDLISFRTTTNGCLDLQPKRSAHHNQHQQLQQHSPNRHHVQSSRANDVNSSSSTSTNITASTTSSTSTTTSTNSSEKTVFGISPKSSSLSRYKNLIEQRASSPVPFGTTGELAELGSTSDRNICTTNNPSTVPSSSTADLKNKYFSTTNSTGNSVLQSNRSSSSATGIVSQVAGNQHYQREPVLEITPDATTTTTNSSLDSCHSPRQSFSSAGNRESSLSTSSWKQQQQHYSSNVNDTAKCIAVGGGGGSTASNSTPNFRSSSNTSTSTTTTTTTTTSSSSSSSSSYLSSAKSSVPSTSSTTPLSPPSTGTAISSSFGGSSSQRTQQPQQKSTTDSSSPVTSLSLSSSTTNSSHNINRSGSPVLSPSLTHHSSSTGVSPVTTPLNSLSPSTQGGSSIDTFIKENEQLFGSTGSNRLNCLLLQRSVGVIEKSAEQSSLDHQDENDYGELLQLNYIDDSEEQPGGDMKIKDSTKLSSLTDDEKALLHETLKAGLYGDPKKKSRMFINVSGGQQTNGQQQQNGQLQQTSKTLADENCDPNDGSSTSTSSKPSRRIILVSKPAPKPEPKPEPKYVNGKVVFGQLPAPKGAGVTGGSGGVLQKGSVAERVMLFEKCPEKTSVTKGKLTELQRERSRALGSPNKIGSWVRGSSGADKDYVKIPKIATNNSNCATSPNGSTQQQQQSANQNHNNNNHHLNNHQPNYQHQKSVFRKEVEATPSPSISSVPTFRRFSRSNSLTGQQQPPPGQLPRFHFPNGRPYSSHEVETQIRRIIAVFERFPSRSVTRKDLGGVLKLVGIPVYWKEPLFCAVVASAKANGIGSQQNLNGIPGLTNGNRRSGSRSNSIDLTANGSLVKNNGTFTNGLATSSKKEYISCEQFTDYWRRLITTCYDDAARFMAIATQSRRNYLLPEDLEGLIQDVVDTHPGLLFLKEAEEFHSRYVHTVIARIFYCLDRTWSGAISLAELRKSNLLKVLQLLEEEEDINQITDYFSYEHFYVIYCKFWELDTDHDLFISKYDLSKHNDSAISSRMIERIFSGAVTRGPRNDSDHQMSYAEFVWFLLSEEDKRHPRAIEYWFRCMDLDGDGALSMYELEYFYSEQVKRMEAAGIEALPFTDCLCQMIDLASPADPLRITLNDLKRCRLTPVFFDTFFNLEKYLDHEQRDPFASQRDEDGLSMSDWDRYAAEEYELLVAEENAASAAAAQNHQSSNRFYDYHHGGSGQTLSQQAARHRYPSEECLNLDEYDEDEDYEEDEEDEVEGEETSSDSAMNDYDCEEELLKRRSFVHESSPSTEDDDDGDSDENWSDCSAASNDFQEEEILLDKDKDSKWHSSTSTGGDEIDDIGREFYEYINAEFAPHKCPTEVKSSPQSSKENSKTLNKTPVSSTLSPSTPQNTGDKSNDFNNNPVVAKAAADAPTLTTLDDDDFW